MIREMKTIRYWVSALLVTELMFVIRIIWSVSQQGILPPPFYFDVNDSFMDFFNTNFWGLRDGRYEIWKSIYPIFSFFVAKVVTNSNCALELSDPFELRACAIWDMGYLVAAYCGATVVCTGIAVRAFEKHVKIQRGRFAIVTFCAILLSLPGLFALERGNYILLAFMFLSLAAFFNNDWKSALCLAAAISLKQYLVVLLLAPLLKRRFDFIALALVLVVALNALAYVSIDETHFHLILENMAGFSSAVDVSFFEKIWYSTSFSAWSKVLENSSRIADYFSFSDVIFLKLVVSSLRFLGMVTSIVAVLWSFRLAAEISWEYISFLTVCVLVLVLDSVGGYALVLILPYLISVLADEAGRRGDIRFPLILPLAFLLLTPADFVVGPSMFFVKHSFVSGEIVSYLHGMTLGAYVRPLAVFSLMVFHVVYLYRCQTNVRRTTGKEMVHICP